MRASTALSLICSYILVCTSGTLSAFPYFERDTTEFSSTTDPVLDWPECNSVQSLNLIELQEGAFAITWDAVLNQRVEYQVDLVQGDEVLYSVRNNCGVHVLQLPEIFDGDKATLQLKTLCYFDSDKEPLESKPYSISWKQLLDEKTLFCDGWRELIQIEELETFVFLRSALPKDINLTFDICEGADCDTYDHAESNSKVVSTNLKYLNFENPKLYRQFHL